VTEAAFIPATVGYAPREVDAFRRDVAEEIGWRRRGGEGRYRPPEVRMVRFSLQREGYSISQVEAFVHKVADELDRLGTHPSDPIVTPSQVQAARFRKRPRGYAMAEVDLFLDRVTTELGRLQAGEPSSLTVERLRAVDFPAAVRGYARDEVDGLLAELGREVARVRARLGG
jgi:DivIVA domain-containing protein